MAWLAADEDAEDTEDESSTAEAGSPASSSYPS
jgi:hypothetical protein